MMDTKILSTGVARRLACTLLFVLFSAASAGPRLASALAHADPVTIVNDRHLFLPLVIKQ